jgi:uncharacterized protein YhbP (UPF0306 family)
MTNPTRSDLDLATGILSRATDLTLASIRPDGTPHASTASFANSGLTVYFAVAIDCQKAHNIQHSSRVAFTVNTAYRNWAEIRGLSIDAAARLVTGVEELNLVSALLLEKYPEFSVIISNPAQLPWPGMLFIRCDPSYISLLDYTKGFGHTVHFQIGATAEDSPVQKLAAELQ